MNEAELPLVDVAVLHRPGHLPCEEVMRALRSQQGVRVRIRLHEGAPQLGDLNRWETIARCRNQAKQYGDAPLFMFVDDDVVLEETCIAELLAELQGDRRLAVVAADYDRERMDPARAGHVGMGATLFRRCVLDQLRFRSTPHWCECWCACWDLRQSGYQIRYSCAARAEHRKQRFEEISSDGPAAGWPHVSRQLEKAQVSMPHILAAFDRRDIDRFERQFLRSLRSSGNPETVIAVAYGLYPTEEARLRKLGRVQLVSLPFNGIMPPVRRLTDFARITQQLPPATPVAYWDVADVLFQDSLVELWQQVRELPDRLLAVPEPKGYPYNQVIYAWSLSICDPHCRLRAFELLKRNPFLNSGFAAGTAATLARYFQEASLMRHQPTLAGTTDWGDQMALNIYCHSAPGRWHAADERWNYCVHDRPPGEVCVTPSGRVVSRSGSTICAAHGNARSLRQFALSTAIS